MHTARFLAHTSHIMTVQEAKKTSGATPSSTYQNWLGHPVILQVVAGELCMPLRGMIVGESPTAVRFRIQLADSNGGTSQQPIELLVPIDSVSRSNQVPTTTTTGN